MKFLALFVVLSTLVFSQSNNIILDEDFEDWNNVTIFEEDANDNISNGVDFKKLWITNDHDYLFIRIDFYNDIIIQEDTSTIILIDTDNNRSTGSQHYNSGAEIKYLFGKRMGYFYANNDSTQIGQNDIKIVSAPTVSSSSYEMKLDLSASINNMEVFPNSELSIKLVNYLPNIDVIPNDDNLSYTINNEIAPRDHEFSINKVDETSFRVLSYNVHRDDIFLEELKPKFTRILKAINPDIITFQEIYDHSSTEVASLIEEMLPSKNGETWYHAKIEPIDNLSYNKIDEILISRYPILESYRIQGMTYPNSGYNQANAAHLIDLPDTETNLLIVNAHPPCCSNYYPRSVELQEIMVFLKDAKNVGGEVTVDENTPIIITGDMNLVGYHEERDVLVFGDIIDNNTYGSDFNPDWDNTPFADSKPFATGFPGVITWYEESSPFSAGRLDYIIYSDYTLNLTNSYSLFTPTIEPSTLVSHNLDSLDAITASDHLPLVADFSVRNLVSVEKNEVIIPNSIKLYQNYPNPFNPVTNISFYLPKQSQISLAIYDVLGRNLETLLNENLEKGNHKIEFDASNYESGIYFYRLTGDGFSLTRKLILLK